MIIKTCKIHGELTEDQVCKERNNYIASGYQLRCIKCRRDKDRKYKLNNPDKHRASASKARNEARKLYRGGLIELRPKADIWAEQDRKNNPEKYRNWSEISRKKQGQLRNTKEVCRRLNVTVEIYYEMLKEQNNKCAICNREERRNSRTKGKICALAIDHCHKTGKIRQLLCHSCNTAIGKFEDNIEYLENAIKYLNKHSFI